MDWAALRRGCCYPTCPRSVALGRCLRDYFFVDLLFYCSSTQYTRASRGTLQCSSFDHRVSMHYTAKIARTFSVVLRTLFLSLCCKLFTTTSVHQSNRLESSPISSWYPSTLWSALGSVEGDTEVEDRELYFIVNHVEHVLGSDPQICENRLSISLI